MSQAAHVGDCPPLIFDVHPDGKAPCVRKPWQRFAVADVDLLLACPWIDGGPDGLEFHCRNGWAIYRRVGLVPARHLQVILELVDCDEMVPA